MEKAYWVVVLILVFVFLSTILQSYSPAFFQVRGFSVFDLLALATTAIVALTAIALLRICAKETKKNESTRRNYETLRSMLDNLPVGVYRSTADGKVLAANSKFAELLGYRDVTELSQVNLNDLYVRESDRLGHLEKLKESTVFAEFEVRRKDRETIWVRDYPNPTLAADGRVNYMDGVIVETSGIEALVRDIGEHRRLDIMRNQFASAVSHELRTPLVSIKGYLDYLLSEDPETKLQDLRPNIEIVKRNADRLLELTNDLLDIQRIESGRLELRIQTVSFRDLLRECVEEIQPLLEQKKQHLHLEIPTGRMSIQGDHLRLCQVLTNLFNNATKFTPHGGDITISVEEKDDVLQVAVHDTGIGIDRRDLDRVFEPFAAIEKPTYYKGTGLGLSLTKRLIDAHGGKITASSPGKGGGATFTFSLPKKRVVEIYG
jgi:PAS domain S-box-containing protein